jgi:NhaA family Na+:H+ antiporter
MPAYRRKLQRLREKARNSEAQFVSTEVLGGVLLLGATVAALIWINVAPGSYADLWNAHLTVGLGAVHVTETTREWVNDGLLAVFFFVVGLEIKRELVCGQLRDARTAALPIVAALGGMLVPALLYALVNFGGHGGSGWGIPMATDVAFVLAALALLAKRIPRSLRLFMLTLAIVDDIGAIIVIAFFYSNGISSEWLFAALIVILSIIVLRRLDASNPILYVVPAVALWYCVLESGVHATLAGVVLGLLTPAAGPHALERIERLETFFHPWSSYLVVPLFALANAGVSLAIHTLRDAVSGSIGLGIMIGLVIGKPLGICAAAAIAVRSRVTRLPDGLSPLHIIGGGMLAGIGFTVSLFIAGLSFAGPQLGEAKIGVLVASIVSGLLGSVVLLRPGRHDRTW